MALRDLLWACPRCAAGPLGAGRRGETCPRCGTTFRRGAGDRIVARSPDGGEETRRAAEWLDALPPPTIPESGTLAGPEPVVLREAPPENSAVHYDGELIGWVERFGPSRQGSLTLTPDALTFRPDAGDEPLVLPVAELTAIQPASSSLQLGLRGRVVSLRFPGSSILRWEMLLQTAVKRLWATKGRGEVLDFQPRIVAR